MCTSGKIMRRTNSSFILHFRFYILYFTFLTGYICATYTGAQMGLLDFLDRRKKDATAEMSFVDHLEELRWHLIRSVIAIAVGAIIVFIYARNVVDDVLFAPAYKTFITYGWLCKVSHALGLGDAICL